MPVYPFEIIRHAGISGWKILIRTAVTVGDNPDQDLFRSFLPDKWPTAIALTGIASRSRCPDTHHSWTPIRIIGPALVVSDMFKLGLLQFGRVALRYSTHSLTRRRGKSPR